MSSNASDPLVYSVKAAVQATSFSRATLYNMMKDGRLKSIKVGGRRVIPRESIERLLAQAEQSAA